ncbi:hypothetical protein MSG28_002678 [Choristoneura fumiferana]|uniref:Uncharacterized protein n=1 Tax=Choristoneura fumiferana TaxID=7141 RepID=A0ACC0JIZ4_CHOFU|nr:hypothetical protein MSG28_002678 [Choristoneura fumiferana]
MTRSSYRPLVPRSSNNSLDNRDTGFPMSSQRSRVSPRSRRTGSKVRMQCVYDLEQEVLYSVKWYRGDREFCRYQPRDAPPLKVFRIPGIEVVAL